MLLSGALLALFMAGFWLYCLTDVILTPATECRGLSKQAWVAVVAVTFIGGACAWLIVRRPVRDSARLRPLPRWDPDPSGPESDGTSENGTDAGDARHQTRPGQVIDAHAAPKGPDDDQEFLRALEAAIRRNPPVS